MYVEESNVFRLFKKKRKRERKNRWGRGGMSSGMELGSNRSILSGMLERKHNQEHSN